MSQNPGKCLRSVIKRTGHSNSKRVTSNSNTLSLEDTLSQLALPQDPATGNPYDGAAEVTFDNTIDRILRRNGQ